MAWKAGIAPLTGWLPVTASPSPLKMIMVPRVTMKALIRPLTTRKPLSAPTAVPAASPRRTDASSPNRWVRMITMPVKAMTDPMDRSKEPLMSRMVMPAAMMPLMVMWLNRLRKFLRVKKFLSAMLRVAIRAMMMTRSFWSAMNRRDLAARRFHMCLLRRLASS